MNMHKNARLTPIGREWLAQAVLSGQTAEGRRTSRRCLPADGSEWVCRFQAEGRDCLTDRSSRPRRLYRPTSATMVKQVESLRRQRLTGKQIAADLGLSPATVGRILQRLGLNHIRDLLAGRAGASLRASPSRRHDSYKHQESLSGEGGLAGLDGLLCNSPYGQQ